MIEFIKIRIFNITNSYLLYNIIQSTELLFNVVASLFAFQIKLFPNNKLDALIMEENKISKDPDRESNYGRISREITNSRLKKNNS